MREFFMFVMFGGVVAVVALALFVVVYLAMRLAIRHERLRISN